MTVKELRRALKDFPDDLEIWMPPTYADFRPVKSAQQTRVGYANNGAENPRRVAYVEDGPLAVDSPVLLSY